jgi:peptidoglycan/xylan/chitin deacetylase (PgdA/CDA1 family)
MRPRRVVKQLLERALVRAGLPRVGRLRSRNRILVLAYHNVLPPHEVETAGDSSLHLSHRDFSAQLELLCRTHSVISLEDALSGRHTDSTRPRAVITFDDAYSGAVRFAVPELVARSLPATIFVSPAFLNGRAFWWDSLAASIAAEPNRRDEALTRLRGEDAVIRKYWGGRSNSETLPPHLLCAGEGDLAAAAQLPGISLGSHTWSHPNLARLDAPELESELRRPLDWLQGRFPGALPILSYPYGLYSRTVEQAAQSIGYRAALRIDGGWWEPHGTKVFSIPRLNVPAGISREAFLLRASGVIG